MARVSIGQILFQRCTTCGLLKDAAEFYKQGHRIRAHCNKCAIKTVTAWTKTNPEKRKANWKRWRNKNKDRANAQNREWYRRHPETKRRYVQNNRERIREISRRSVKKNLAKYNVNWHNRRARMLGNGGVHTLDDIKAIYSQQGGKCANLACRKKLKKYHVDHVVPISAGGTNGPDNLQLLCVTCNLKKNAKLPEQWAKENGLLF